MAVRSAPISPTRRSLIAVARAVSAAGARTDPIPGTIPARYPTAACRSREPSPLRTNAITPPYFEGDSSEFRKKP